MGERGHPPAQGVGDRPLVADRRQPGRDPARFQRRHPRIQMGREGDRTADDVLGPGGLRGDRAPPRRQRPAQERRFEPRKPPVRRGRRGDPHRQPDRRREAGEPRVPRLLRERVQRHPRRGAVRLGGDPGMDRRRPREAPRRPAARTPRRHLSVPSRGDVRRRPRPDRLRRAHRHDARPPCRLCHLLELRRGCAPLRPRAGGHAGGAAKARPAVRPYRSRTAVRGSPYAIVVLSDHGQTQGATFKQRNGYGLDDLVGTLAGVDARCGGGRRRRAGRDGRQRPGRSDRRRKSPNERRTTSPGRRRSSSAPATSGSST